MNETSTPAKPEFRVVRSIAAVFAGILLTFILSLGTDATLHGMHLFPPWGEPMAERFFVVASVYRLAYNTLGCAVAARIAPSRPMLHAMILGVIGFVLSGMGALATWNRVQEMGPRWYPLLLVASALPCAWIGGRLGTPKATPRDAR